MMAMRKKRRRKKDKNGSKRTPNTPIIIMVPKDKNEYTKKERKRNSRSEYVLFGQLTAQRITNQNWQIFA